MRRGKPLRQVSEKRVARGRERDHAVQRALARDRYQCQAVGLGDVVCHGRLDPHERIPRSAWADGIYDVDNIVTVCRAHHHWIDNNPTAAAGFNLHGYSHERSDDGNPERH